VSPELHDPIEVGRKLLLRRYLPRQPHDAALDDVVVDGRVQRPAAEAVGGQVGPVRRIQVVEGIGHGLIDAPAAERGEEPQAVFLHRSAEAGVEIVNLLDAVRRLQPLSP
jgi:hypothetical protein